MRGVFPTVAAIVFSLSLSATAATVDEEPVPFPALPDPSESQGKGPPTQKGAPTLSPEERARSAKALVDRNGNGLSDGLEDRLATLGPDEPVDVIVTFSGPGDSASARAAVGNFSVKHEYSLIPGFAATMRAAQAQALAAAPGVFRVEEDVRVHAFMESGLPDYGVGDLATDPETSGLTGKDVRICFVDSGIQGDHEAFNVHNPDDGTILSTRIDGFMDFIGDINGNIQIDPYDDFGHGTHVAGIAASDGEAGPFGLGGDPVNAPKARGVAPDALILMAKVLDFSGGGPDSGVIAGIQWCVDQGADIVSASLGVPGSSDCSNALCQAMENAVSAGVIAVVAAGNEGDMFYTTGTPAASPSAITVGAGADFSAPPGEPWTTLGIFPAPFSSLGPTANEQIKPDIMAPGVTVLSAYSDAFGFYGCGIGCYAVLSGTSMATPYVAGVVALMLQDNPLLPDVVKQTLYDTAQDRLTLGKDNVYGHGLLDALAAVKSAHGYVETPNDFPSYYVANDSVPDNGQTDILITVDDPNLPLAVAVTLDGQAICTLNFLGQCLQYQWDPDIEADIYLNDGNGNPVGNPVFSSGCPGIGECGAAGRQETVLVAPPLAASYTLRVHPCFVSCRPDSVGQGGTFTYEVSNGSGPYAGNLLPVADAGGDQTKTDKNGNGIESVTLDGSDSYDQDGLIDSYEWWEGETLLSNDPTPTLSLAVAVHTITLKVFDDGGAWDDDTVVVEVKSKKKGGGGDGGEDPGGGSGGGGGGPNCEKKPDHPKCP